MTYFSAMKKFVEKRLVLEYLLDSIIAISALWQGHVLLFGKLISFYYLFPNSIIRGLETFSRCVMKIAIDNNC